MRLALSALAAALALTAQTTHTDGKWRAIFTAPQDLWPKTVSEVILDLKTDGDKLTGTAHMGNWPGKMPLMDGKIEANRISFTVVSQLAWRRTGPGIDAHGLPRITFTGAIEGDQMKLHLVWDSVMIYGEPGPVRTYDMDGVKVQR